MQKFMAFVAFIIALIGCACTLIGCACVSVWPYSCDDISNAVLFALREANGVESTWVFRKIVRGNCLSYLERMFLDEGGISEADPEYFVVKQDLRQKLLRDEAGMFYACQNDNEVFLCIDYNADETNAKGLEEGSLLWRWQLLYRYLYVVYDANLEKYCEICTGFISGEEIEDYHLKMPECL